MTNLTGTTWRFNDNFTPPSSLIVMANSPSTKELFTCAGTSFYRMNGAANLYFSTIFTSSTEQINVYNNGWTANKYRVITFTDEPASFNPDEETVMTWFEANATQIDFDKLLNLSDAKLLYQDLKQKIDAKINDTSTSTDKTWSSNKIDTTKANITNPEFNGSIVSGNYWRNERHTTSNTPQWTAGTHYYYGDVVYTVRTVQQGGQTLSRYSLHMCVEENTDTEWHQRNWISSHEYYGLDLPDSYFMKEIVGYGSDASNLKNIRTLDVNGNERLAGALILGNTTLTETKLQQLLALIQN